MNLSDHFHRSVAGARFPSSLDEASQLSTIDAQVQFLALRRGSASAYLISLHVFNLLGSMPDPPCKQ